MFNSVMQIIEATFFSDESFKLLLILTDDKGCIDIFLVEMPKRRSGTSYNSERVYHHKIHGDFITDMKSIP